MAVRGKTDLTFLPFSKVYYFVFVRYIHVDPARHTAVDPGRYLISPVRGRLSMFNNQYFSLLSLSLLLPCFPPDIPQQTCDAACTSG